MDSLVYKFVLREDFVSHFALQDQIYLNEVESGKFLVSVYSGVLAFW